MRTLWQGVEGIAWLCACEQSALQSGEFYLDRTPQRKHMAGPFFSDGSYTKNTNAEAEEMVRKLDEHAARSACGAPEATPSTEAVLADLSAGEATWGERV